MRTQLILLPRQGQCMICANTVPSIRRIEFLDVGPGYPTFVDLCGTCYERLEDKYTNMEEFNENIQTEVRQLPES